MAVPIHGRSKAKPNFFLVITEEHSADTSFSIENEVRYLPLSEDDFTGYISQLTALTTRSPSWETTLFTTPVIAEIERMMYHLQHQGSLAQRQQFLTLFDGFKSMSLTTSDRRELASLTRLSQSTIEYNSPGFTP